MSLRKYFHCIQTKYSEFARNQLHSHGFKYTLPKGIEDFKLKR